MVTASPLTLALVELARQGRRPPCGELDCREWFTSEDPAERKRASLLCRVCPLRTACLREGLQTRATAGIWGAEDLTDLKPAKRRQLLTQLDPHDEFDIEPLF